MGAFAEWQPQYAERGIATFPVDILEDGRKKPAVGGYLKLGARYSAQLTMKFGGCDALGLACSSNKITVLDVDTPDERVLADALSRHGQTPFVVRTGSGNWQAWYRHNGESRKIRPESDKPIDILGGGYVVAPPSMGRKGRYELVQGSLDDLANLPRMLPLAKPANDAGCKEDVRQEREPVLGKIKDGRNDALWRHCMKIIRGCANVEELMGKAMDHNREAFYEPLPDAEVLKVVASAMTYEREGKNWFGHGARVVMENDIVDNLAATEPRAFALFTILMRHHWGRTFKLAKAHAAHIGWAVNTWRDARDVLIRVGLIECIHEGGKGPNDPPEYQFAKGVKK
nr:hypothetical protein REQ54_01760 [Rhizobium sp. Q54]